MRLNEKWKERLKSEVSYMDKKKQSAVGWAFAQAGRKKPQLVLSVIVAVCGVICKVIPFLLAGQIMLHLLDGDKTQGGYLKLFGLMVLCFVGNAVFHAISTSLSHGAAFEILANIRKKGLDHLAQMPLGNVLAKPAGTIKNILVEQVDSMETTIAHIIPEFHSPRCHSGYVFGFAYPGYCGAAASLPGWTGDGSGDFDLAGYYAPQRNWHRHRQK